MRPPKLQSRFVPMEYPYGGNEPPKREEPIPALAMDGSEFKEIQISDDEAGETSSAEQPTSGQSVLQPAMHSQNGTSAQDIEEMGMKTQAGSKGAEEKEECGKASEQEDCSPRQPEQLDGCVASVIAADADAHAASEPCSNYVEVTQARHDALNGSLPAWDGEEAGDIAAKPSSHASWELKAQVNIAQLG